LIRLAVFQASGGARVKLHVARALDMLNVEHRTSNFERPMLRTLRFIYLIQANRRILNCKISKAIFTLFGIFF